MILQKLSNKGDEFVLAEKYYGIISVLNNLKLTEREIQLVSFTAIKGNISYNTHKEEFCKKYNSTSPTINNIISKLRKQGIFIKDNGKIKINPIITIDFTKDFILQIKLLHG